MSAAALTWRKVPDAIDRLPHGEQHAATVAYKALRRRERDGTLDETATDERLGEEAGWSASLVQKGLHALDVLLGKLGLALIGRESGIGMHGRRQITFKPLAGEAGSKGDDDAASIVVSPQSPGGGAGGGPAADPAEYPSEDLISRACRLVPKATRGRVVDAVGTYGSEWLTRALDRVEQRNKTSGNKPVRSWGFVLSTLANWKNEGGPPPEDSPPPPPAAARARTILETAAEDIRNARIQAAWQALDAHRRDQLRTAVLADSPHLIRWPAMIEAECLARLEHDLVEAGELPRAP
jgi:hypothetical protein